VPACKKGTSDTGTSYKASVLANEKRVVIAARVDPSSEIKVVKPMLEDVESLSGQIPKQWMFDAGYNCEDVLDLALENNADLLCPAGRTNSDGSEKESKSKYFPKSTFEYNEQTDSYRCPAGEELKPSKGNKGSSGQPEYVRYGTRACTKCELRDKCTKSAQGRKVKRYAFDEKKDALRDVMRQKGAQRRYLKRQAIVEPVFSELRGIQNLSRFRRRGIAGVGLEFILHAIAHNLRRALAAFLLVLLGLCRQILRCDSEWNRLAFHPHSARLRRAGLPLRGGDGIWVSAI